mmetsp:Transcript_2043/g.3543  ORF Transcript_2043/g.3543 Transcript_2043/m.3543 type:complete len:318 (+) Transcript_2043:341-1294(+)
MVLASRVHAPCHALAHRSTRRCLQSAHAAPAPTLQTAPPSSPCRHHHRRHEHLPGALRYCPAPPAAPQAPPPRPRFVSHDHSTADWLIHLPASAQYHLTARGSRSAKLVLPGPPRSPNPPHRATPNRPDHATRPLKLPMRSAPPEPPEATAAQSDQTPRPSLAQPIQQRRHMHLIAFVVSSQHMHDQVHPKTIGQLALPLSGPTAPHREERVAAGVHCPGRAPIVAANDHRRYPVIEIAKRHAFDLLCIRQRRLNPDIPAHIAPRKILQQVERPCQHMILRQWVKRRYVQASGEFLQLSTCRTACAKPRHIAVARVK